MTDHTQVTDVVEPYRAGDHVRALYDTARGTATGVLPVVAATRVGNTTWKISCARNWAEHPTVDFVVDETGCDVHGYVRPVDGPRLDARDRAILADRVAQLAQVPSPSVGDFVRFADDVLRRVAHVWPDGVQTSDRGSYYLGPGFVSMSGSLFTPVPQTTLSRTDDTVDGTVWFFHHDVPRPHNGVRARIAFPLFVCTMPSTATH